MDSLGERLCEGCRRAYVLRFDGDSLSSRDGQSGRQGDAKTKRPRRSPRTPGPPPPPFIGDGPAFPRAADLGARILAKDAEDPDPETLMRRLQIEFHRVEAERA